MFRIPIINGCIRHAGVTSGFEYYFEKISLWLSNYIVANSHAGLKHYGLEKSKKASVVYNFIDASRFKESECRSPILVMTANFTLYKDHRTMLFCAERLILENKIQKLNLIGGGPGLQKWQKWVTDKQLQNKIFFYGKISNVEELLSECSIGILCSTSKYKEGISNSILEYMGSGLLAIASDIGGTSEIIEDGKNGLLFEVENQDSLYRCITWALSNQNESKVVSQNGTDTVKSKFSVQTNSELLLKVYNKFI
jgi:glycosyltransferase involved in cell wall biosynthesis